MFDFDAGKILIIGVVALIVIGPKELPRVLRQVGQAVGRMKRMAAEFQGQFMDAMKEADVQSIRDEVNKLNADAQLDMHFDPARDIQSELTKSLASSSDPIAPGLAETPAPVTDGFALAAPTDPKALTGDVEAAEPIETPAMAGFAPVAEQDTDAAELVSTGEHRPSARKRKIVLSKRARPTIHTAHDVSDRTGSPRGRIIRARRQEAGER